MTKQKGTYAGFDVCNEDVLLRISEWREKNVLAKLNENLTGDLKRCTGGNDEEPNAWRTHASNRKLLTLCAHGDGGAVKGCNNKIYVNGDALGAHAEVPGAVIHLLACQTMPDLGKALVGTGGAEAVIGYSTAFTFADDGPSATAIPSTTVSALQCDAQILFGLAAGKTVRDAILSSKQWERQETMRLIFQANLSRLRPMKFLDIVWRLAVMTNNSQHLASAGNSAATIL